MTADVNVTEKVAQALCPSLWDDTYPEHLREGLRHLPREQATASLAALSDPEVLAGIAGVLYEADPLPDRPSWGELRSESAKWPDGVARWAETRALERASALADWLRGRDDR